MLHPCKGTRDCEWVVRLSASPHIYTDLTTPFAPNKRPVRAPLAQRHLHSLEPVLGACCAVVALSQHRLQQLPVRPVVCTVRQHACSAGERRARTALHGAAHPDHGPVCTFALLRARGPHLRATAQRLCHAPHAPI